MAKRKLDELMEEALEVANDAWARSRLDANSQRVTVTRHNIKAAFAEATHKYFLREGKPNPLTAENYNTIGAAALRGLKAGIKRSRTSALQPEDSTSNKVVFIQTRTTRLPFRQMKLGGQAELKKILGLKESDQLDPELVKDIDLGTQRLHKDTTVGLVRLGRAIEYITENGGAWFEANGYSTVDVFRDVTDKYGELLAQFVIDSKAKGRKNQVKYNGHVEVDVARKGRNWAGSQENDWKHVKPVLENAIGNWLESLDIEDQEGSSTIKEDIIANAEITVLDTLLEVQGAKLKGKKPTRPKTRKRNGDANRHKKSKARSPRKKSMPALTTAKKSNFSVTILLGMLNERLVETVAKNMKSPALVNRSGRFASSVRVTDVIPTTKGFPSVGYTYQKNPYQTFEQGFAQGSTERDPRRLIDRSIREIAAGLAIGRLYTRRV